MRILFIAAVYTLVSISGMAQLPRLVEELQVNPDIKVGAERFDEYLPFLEGKAVGIVANQTSLVGKEHLVDILVAKKIDIKKVFSPEHGFRGEAANGEIVKSDVDSKTGLPLVSLYGKNKKPTQEMLSGLDVVVFDIQDVGARFYTYISTMHYVMEACAEIGIKVVVLDRPNPNGFYVDGPVLKEAQTSFVGMHPIPVVHGLTVGELAKMINGEGWLKNDIRCDLEVVKCDSYSHRDLYIPPVPPSPNLPTIESIYLYPSLCFFEATKVSVGRGTERPFEIVGHPIHRFGTYEYTPLSMPGKSLHPKYENEICSGHDLKSFGDFYFKSARQIYLGWLVQMYVSYPEQKEFFTQPSFFDKLAGQKELRQMILDGKTEEEIRRSWESDLINYKKIRSRYLLYPDFS